LGKGRGLYSSRFGKCDTSYTGFTCGKLIPVVQKGGDAPLCSPELQPFGERTVNLWKNGLEFTACRTHALHTVISSKPSARRTHRANARPSNVGSRRGISLAGHTPGGEAYTRKRRSTDVGRASTTHKALRKSTDLPCRLKHESRTDCTAAFCKSCVESCPELGTHEAVFLRRRTAELRHSH
jgi:hypothetical protein